LVINIETVIRVGKRCLPLMALAGMVAVNALAQGPFSGVASGFTSEAVAVVRTLAIAMVMFFGVWMMISPHHIVGKAAGALVGLYIALNPQPVASWIQSL